MFLVYPAHENADYNIGFKPESKGEKKKAAGSKKNVQVLQEDIPREYSRR